MCTPNRKIKGEELHGMDIEELRKLEKVLEVGLSRVLETKACLCVISVCCNSCGVLKYMYILLISETFLSFRVKDFWKRSLSFSER